MDTPTAAGPVLQQVDHAIGQALFIGSDENSLDEHHFQYSFHISSMGSHHDLVGIRCSFSFLIHFI
jgi:hypothetical protein